MYPPSHKSVFSHHATLKYVLITLIVLGIFMAIGAGILAYLFSGTLSGRLNSGPAYSAQELSTKAGEQVAKGDYLTAEQYLEQALTKTDDPTYRNQLAVVKYRLKKYDESIAQYQRLIKSGKDTAFAWNGIGNAYRDWMATAPSSQAVHYRVKAEEAYKSCITADPQYVAAYSNMALLLKGEGKGGEALSELDAGIVATGSKELQEIRSQLQKQ